MECGDMSTLSTARTCPRTPNWRRLLDLHFLPNTAFFLPFEKRFPFVLVNGRFRTGYFSGFYQHEKINVVKLAVGAFHIDTREIFIIAKIREPVVMNFDQIEREIFTLIW